MKFHTYIIILSIIFSCQAKTEVELGKQEIFASLQEEMAIYPGLGFKKDTAIRLVRIYNPKDDVIHGMFVFNENNNFENLEDSLLKIENYKNYLVDILQVDSKPIPIYRDYLTFFMSGGFDDKNIDFFQNEVKMDALENTSKKLSTIYEYFKVDKLLIDSIGVSVNNSKAVYSVINKEYNYLELFLIKDSVVQFNYTYHWNER